MVILSKIKMEIVIDMWQHGTNDRSTLTQTGDRNTNTSNQDAEIIIYRRIDKW
jgi:hypothetical protein